MPPVVVATIQYDAVHDMIQLCRNFAKSEISISDENPQLLPSFVQTAVIYLSRGSRMMWLNQFTNLLEEG